MSILRAKLKVVRVFENHLELRHNFLAPTKCIRNENFVNYEINSNKLIIHYRDYDETLETYIILENKMRKDDFDDFLLLLIKIKQENTIKFTHNHIKSQVFKKAI